MQISYLEKELPDLSICVAAVFHLLAIGRRTSEHFSSDDIVCTVLRPFGFTI